MKNLHRVLISACLCFWLYFLLRFYCNVRSVYVTLLFLIASGSRGGGKEGHKEGKKSDKGGKKEPDETTGLLGAKQAEELAAQSMAMANAFNPFPTDEPRPGERHSNVVRRALAQKDANGKPINKVWLYLPYHIQEYVMICWICFCVDIILLARVVYGWRLPPEHHQLACAWRGGAQQTGATLLGRQARTRHQHLHSESAPYHSVHLHLRGPLHLGSLHVQGKHGPASHENRNHMRPGFTCDALNLFGCLPRRVGNSCNCFWDNNNFFLVLTISVSQMTEWYWATIYLFFLLLPVPVQFLGFYPALVRYFSFYIFQSNP